MLACPRCRATYPDDVAECPEDGAALLPSDMVSALDAPIEPGTMVGEYRVERRLGSGTFGDVYAGEQPLIGKRVAIKLLHRRYSSDAEVVSRFVAEARAVNRIRHRNIIDIFSFGLLDDKRHYFVMELLDGLTLRELLDRERRLPVEKALPILRGIASGLDAAHEAGITHRDLKPDNVFLAVERDGTLFPKLLDFGIAKLLGEDVAHKTATGVAMGTPRYMSPEQCRGRKTDHRADIYSLGVLVHEVLTGRPLFEAESTMEVLFLHMNEAPGAMSAVSPDLPPELDEPVLAMLAKRPKDRPDSAGEAISALVKRAREHGMAATLPVSSAGVQAALRTDREPSAGERLPADVATVAVRKRATPAPSGSGAERASEVATVEMSGARGTGTLPGEPAGGATAKSEPTGSTLRSPVAPTGDAPASAPASRETSGPSRAPARGAGFWAIVAIVAVAGAAIALSRSGSPPATTTAAPETHAVPSGAPSSPAGETKVTPDPAPLPEVKASSAPTASASAVAPAAATGKPIAKPKYHGDLEPPPR